tara:strand:+ start:4236 stop:5243 length:1008 start_codon:yes stop_codon:yes gene_type:complete
MSFPDAHFTQFSKSDIAYRQYAPDDPVTDSIYDVNMECDSSLRYQNRAILVVDSKNRGIREEPNKYNLKLNKVYRDVVSIELKKASIPNSDYIINENNNMFYFQDSPSQINKCQYHTLQLPIGNYPIDDECCDSIRSLLEAGMNMVDSDNQYEVTVDPNTMLFTFNQTMGSGIFNILFRVPKIAGEGSGNQLLKSSMFQIIGFKPIDNTGMTSYTGNYAYNLRPSQYIILKIKGLERVDSNHDGIQDSFCVLGMDTTLNNFMRSNNCDDLDNEVYQKDFNPPLQELDRLNIEFLNHNGEPYNFRGRDHCMVFEIVSLSRHSNYHKYSQAPGKKGR